MIQIWYPQNAKKSSIESCIAQNVWLIDTESKNLSSNIEQSRRIPISAVCFSILIRVCMFQHTCFSLVLKALTHLKHAICSFVVFCGNSFTTTYFLNGSSSCTACNVWCIHFIYSKSEQIRASKQLSIIVYVFSISDKMLPWQYVL